MRKATLVSTLAAVAASAGQGCADLRNIGRICDFLVISQNTAGTNPTMTPKLQSSPPPVAGPFNSAVGATVTSLFTGATTNNKLDTSFTAPASGALSLYQVQKMLQYIGAFAPGAATVQLDIFADSAGSPTGSSLGASTPIDIGTGIPTAFNYVTFTWPKPLDLTASTVYHIVMSATYSASAVNCVQERSLTVASGGNQQTFNNTTWTPVATQAEEYNTSFLLFTDFPANFAIGNPMQAYVQQTGALSISRQVISCPLNSGLVNEFIRLYCTIGGTASPSFNVACECIGDGDYNY